MTRQAYHDRLLALMATHPRVVCVDTDTGLFTAADRAAAGDRYIDLGIAEHTAMGVSAALAAQGWMPFVTMMATFASTRALEAVKINIAQNGLPVRIMATHGGVAAGHLGPTHHALEDLAADLDGPVYVRLGRKPTPGLPGDPRPPRIGQIQPLRDGDEVLIVCCGPHPVLESLAAAAELGQAGIATGVLNAHTLKPFDAETLLTRAAPAALVVTVEEHRVAGGLGGVVAELLAERLPRRLLRIGLPEALAPVCGSPEHILKLHGLDAGQITARVRAALDAGLATRSTS